VLQARWSWHASCWLASATVLIVPTGESHHHAADCVDHRLRVLVVITSAKRRGAEIEGVQLTHQLCAAGCAADVVALAVGAGNSLDVDVLGPSPTSLATLRALRRSAREVDVVVGYGSSTLPACAFALSGTRTPFIYRSIGDPSAWVRGALHRRRTGLLFRRAAHVVALSESSSSTIGTLYHVSPARRSAISNARAADRYQPPSPRERSVARRLLGLAEDASVAVSIGSLTTEKRTGLAISAATILGDLTVLVAGDGPERDRLAAEATLVPDGRAHLLGEIDDPRPLLHAADVLLLTSSTEGMPGVVIEAGLCGVPVVATDVGMMSDLVVDGRTGILVKSSDPVEISKATKRALENRDVMGRRAFEHARANFTWDAVMPAWLDVLELVADRSIRQG
jgi:glycosyltransferase involved in cell wall biosynthesis